MLGFVDGFFGACGGARYEKAGGGVEQNNVATGAGLAAQDVVGDLGVGEAVAAAQGVERGSGQAEIGGLPVFLRHHAVFDLPDCRAAGEGDFVEAVGAVDQELAAGVEVGQCLGHLVADAFAGHSDELGLGAGRVAEGAHQVQCRADFEFAADRGGVAEGGVELRREKEPDSGFADRFAHLFGREVDDDTQGFEHVGAAAQGACRAIAVFRHLDAGAGDDEGRDSRNVKSISLVAAGAACVQRRAEAGVDEEHLGAHGAGEPGQNIGRGFVGRENGEEGGELDGGHFSGQNEAHGAFGFIRMKRFFADPVVKNGQKG